jgi:hypothetical protein
LGELEELRDAAAVAAASYLDNLWLEIAESQKQESQSVEAASVESRTAEVALHQEILSFGVRFQLSVLQILAEIEHFVVVTEDSAETGDYYQASQSA